MPPNTSSSRKMASAPLGYVGDSAANITGAKNDRRARTFHPVVFQCRSVGATRASQGSTLNHLASRAA